MLSSVWDDFLKIVKEEIGSRVVETWLKAVSLQQWDAATQTVYVEAPNIFVKEWIQNRYEKVFRVHLGRLLHVSEPKVVFFAKAEEQTVASASIMPARRTIVPTQVKNAVAQRHIPRQSGTLNPHYTFETFVDGPNSSLAYAAAQAVAQEPGVLYNPLFIYGGSGLGKTHLLHAIGNAVREKSPKTVVLYQTADRFVNEFINAIRFNKVHVFQQKYRMIDILLVDDIQFISNKEQTQEAFFHIFNTLHDSSKQIVFSSDVFPRRIKGVAERLRSRLEWGLVSDVHKPPLETKIAILKKKALAQGEPISDEIAEFIAEQADSNVRELEGSLVRVLAFASLTRQPVSLEIARKVLQKTINKEQTTIDFNHIVNCVCRHYSYKLSDLRSSSRAKEVSMVRQIAMYLMKQMTDKSLREISTYLGRKDHSTVIHALDKVEQSVGKDAVLRTTLRRLEEEILR